VDELAGGVNTLNVISQPVEVDECEKVSKLPPPILVDDIGTRAPSEDVDVKCLPLPPTLANDLPDLSIVDR